MAASDSPPPPDNTKHASGGWPSGPASWVHPPWCDNWPQDIEIPDFWCQVCGC
ncbi:TPA: hypothetical protein ACNUH4_000290 [Salmonella enterica subsp. enterica serovar Derby]